MAVGESAKSGSGFQKFPVTGARIVVDSVSGALGGRLPGGDRIESRVVGWRFETVETRIRLYKMRLRVARTRESGQRKRIGSGWGEGCSFNLDRTG